MNIEELKVHVRRLLSAALPAVTIQIAPLSENSGDLGISVFGVERNAIRWVKDIILDLDAELCSGTDSSLTPLVRDVETTRKFYPQYLNPWTSEVDSGQCSHGEIIPATAPNSFLFIADADGTWVPAVTGEVCAMAANEELALAA